MIEEGLNTLQSTTIEWKLVDHTKVVSKGRSSVSIEGEGVYIVNMYAIW